jgi:release factor glutamine methyltransferase
MTETLGSTLAEAATALSAAGRGEARRRARQLVTSVLGISSSELTAHPEREITKSQAQHLRWMVGRLLKCEPPSRVLGRREFWGIEFALSADTLDPRPESETVVDAVLRRVTRRDTGLRLLDLGTGSGCLLLALLSELPAATGIAVDITAGAATTARINAASLGVSARAFFFVGEWCKALTQRFAVVVANPPYIARRALDDLPRAVREYDPPRALDGGADGLEGYHAIGTDLQRVLTPDGFFVIEVGNGQADPVARVLLNLGLAIENVEHDLAGLPRCVVGRPAHSEAVRRRRREPKNCWNVPTSRLG